MSLALEVHDLRNTLFGHRQHQLMALSAAGTAECGRSEFQRRDFTARQTSFSSIGINNRGKPRQRARQQEVTLQVSSLEFRLPAVATLDACIESTNLNLKRNGRPYFCDRARRTTVEHLAYRSLAQNCGRKKLLHHHRPHFHLCLLQFCIHSAETKERTETQRVAFGGGGGGWCLRMVRIPPQTRPP
jgi:hypothetical protein